MADTAPAPSGTDSSKGNAAYDKPANGPASKNQPLTHYHSFFSDLLSWNNPRNSAIAYASVVSLIFAVRYLDIIRYGFKLTWMTLGVTVLAEAVGKAVLKNGLVSQLRPRSYYTIPKETLNAVLGDVHELINFFVIESQRILFAENILASASAAVGAFISYYLVKVVPYWGLALIATTIAFFAPLIYKSNQELIDHHVAQAADLVNSQTEQLRQVASKHTSQGVELTKQYMGDYTAKAQQMIRGRSASPVATSKPAPASTVKASDFPEAPKEDIKTKETPEEEPLIAA